MKLELKHIAGYLHYGLKCKILNWKNDYIGEEYGIIDGYYFCAEEPHFYLNNGKSRDNAGKSFDNIKPILRPLSDLTKEIEINGEKFMPIIRLAKIEQGYWDELEFFERELQVKQCGVREAESPCYYCEWIDGLNQLQSFAYKDGDFSRLWLRDISKFHGIEACLINNQYLLFEKLHSWHFDTHGLIENGLAIDINTLKT